MKRKLVPFRHLQSVSDWFQLLSSSYGNLRIVFGLYFHIYWRMVAIITHHHLPLFFFKLLNILVKIFHFSHAWASKAVSASFCSNSLCLSSIVWSFASKLAPISSNLPPKVWIVSVRAVTRYISSSLNVFKADVALVCSAFSENVIVWSAFSWNGGSDFRSYSDSLSSIASFTVLTAEWCSLKRGTSCLLVPNFSPRDWLSGS